MNNINVQAARTLFSQRVLSHMTKVKTSKHKRVLFKAGVTVSLEQLITENNEQKVAEFFTKTAQKLTDKELTENQKIVLALRFGVSMINFKESNQQNGYKLSSKGATAKKMSFEKIADYLRISIESARQIEKAAFSKIWKHLFSRTNSQK